MFDKVFSMPRPLVEIEQEMDDSRHEKFSPKRNHRYESLQVRCADRSPQCDRTEETDQRNVLEDFHSDGFVSARIFHALNHPFPARSRQGAAALKKLCRTLRKVNPTLFSALALSI